MLNRLNVLTERIRKNQAYLSEYNEYEEILTHSGAFSHNEIQQYLRRSNLVDYNELIDARRRAKTLEDKKTVEGVAVVGLVALGLALIFASKNIPESGRRSEESNVDFTVAGIIRRNGFIGRRAEL